MIWTVGGFDIEQAQAQCHRVYGGQFCQEGSRYSLLRLIIPWVFPVRGEMTSLFIQRCWSTLPADARMVEELMRVFRWRLSHVFATLGVGRGRYCQPEDGVVDEL
jgi:hypothetical protein